jgi:hypothetical protein
MGSMIVGILGINALIFSAFLTICVGMMYFHLIFYIQYEKQKEQLQEPILN